MADTIIKDLKDLGKAFDFDNLSQEEVASTGIASDEQYIEKYESFESTTDNPEQDFDSFMESDYEDFSDFDTDADMEELESLIESGNANTEPEAKAIDSSENDQPAVVEYAPTSDETADVDTPTGIIDYDEDESAAEDQIEYTPEMFGISSDEYEKAIKEKDAIEHAGERTVDYSFIDEYRNEKYEDPERDQYMPKETYNILADIDPQAANCLRDAVYVQNTDKEQSLEGHWEERAIKSVERIEHSSRKINAESEHDKVSAKERYVEWKNSIGENRGETFLNPRDNLTAKVLGFKEGYLGHLDFEQVISKEDCIKYNINPTFVNLVSNYISRAGGVPIDQRAEMREAIINARDFADKYESMIVDARGTDKDFLSVSEKLSDVENALDREPGNANPLISWLNDISENTKDLLEPNSENQDKITAEEQNNNTADVKPQKEQLSPEIETEKNSINNRLGEIDNEKGEIEQKGITRTEVINSPEANLVDREDTKKQQSGAGVERHKPTHSDSDKGSKLDNFATMASTSYRGDSVRASINLIKSFSSFKGVNSPVETAAAVSKVIDASLIFLRSNIVDTAAINIIKWAAVGIALLVNTFKGYKVDKGVEASNKPEVEKSEDPVEKIDKDPVEKDEHDPVDRDEYKPDDAIKDKDDVEKEKDQIDSDQQDIDRAGQNEDAKPDEKPEEIPDREDSTIPDSNDDNPHDFKPDDTNEELKLDVEAEDDHDDSTPDDNPVEAQTPDTVEAPEPEDIEPDSDHIEAQEPAEIEQPEQPDDTVPDQQPEVENPESDNVDESERPDTDAPEQPDVENHEPIDDVAPDQPEVEATPLTQDADIPEQPNDVESAEPDMTEPQDANAIEAEPDTDTEVPEAEDVSTDVPENAEVPESQETDVNNTDDSSVDESLQNKETAVEEDDGREESAIASEAESEPAKSDKTKEDFMDAAAGGEIDKQEIEPDPDNQFGKESIEDYFNDKIDSTQVYDDFGGDTDAFLKSLDNSLSDMNVSEQSSEWMQSAYQLLESFGLLSEEQDKINDFINGHEDLSNGFENMSRIEDFPVEPEATIELDNSPVTIERDNISAQEEARLSDVDAGAAVEDISVKDALKDALLGATGVDRIMDAVDRVEAMHDGDLSLDNFEGLYTDIASLGDQDKHDPVKAGIKTHDIYENAKDTYEAIKDAISGGAEGTSAIEGASAAEGAAATETAAAAAEGVEAVAASEEAVEAIALLL